MQGDGRTGELEEIETLAGIATGARWPEQWGSAREALDFYDVKADALSALTLTGDTSDVRFEADALELPASGTRRANLSRRRRRWAGWVRFIRRLSRPLICRLRHFYLN